MDQRTFPELAWPSALLDDVIALVRAAGDLVLGVYATDFTVDGKPDLSPVTEADRLAEAWLVPGLSALLPGVPVVAEEQMSAGQTVEIGDRFWLVDPLDGTREFVARNGEFTVNVALVVQGRPVLGVVLAPALGLLYAGVEGGGAFMEQSWPNELNRTERTVLRCRPVPPDGWLVVGSRSHGDAKRMDEFLAGHRIAGFRAAGSSLKLCLIASAEADLYPRLGRTMEWDIAAGHAVLVAAGGHVHTLDGKDLRYGKSGFDNPHFVAMGATPWDGPGAGMSQ